MNNFALQQLLAAAAAAVVWWAFPALQLKRTFVNKAGVDSTGWTMLLLVQVLWLLYAAGTFNIALIVTEVGAIALMGAVVLRVGDNRRQSVGVAVGLGVGLGVVTLMAGPVPALIVANMISGAGTLSQTRTLWTERSIAGVSAGSWAAALVGYILWLWLAVRQGDMWLAGAMTVSVVLAAGLLSSVVVIRWAAHRLSSTPSRQGSTVSSFQQS